MPNRTIYFYDDTYCVIQEKATKKEVSKYINELIRRDVGELSNGKTGVSKTSDVGSIPTSPAKIKNTDEPKWDGTIITNSEVAVKVTENIEPKSINRGPGYCVNGHFAGVGMKTCKLCGVKVR